MRTYTPARWDVDFSVAVCCLGHSCRCCWCRPGRGRRATVLWTHSPSHSTLAAMSTEPNARPMSRETKKSILFWVVLTASLIGIWLVALTMWRASEFPNASQDYARWTWSDVAVAGVVLFGPFTMLVGALYRPIQRPWRIGVAVLLLLWGISGCSCSAPTGSP